MSVRWLMSASAKTVKITISASVRSPNILALATAAGYSAGMQIECTVNSGVDVAALQVSGIPDDVLHIINNGRIGGTINSGTGIYTRTRIRVTNNGTIFGGGGAGGSGGSAWVKYTFDEGIFWAMGGGGGNGAGFSASGTVQLLGSQFGDSGGYWRYGGAVLGGETAPWAQGGTGGNGGSLGQAGIGGGYATWGGSYQSYGEGPPYSGGQAGYYVDGNAYINWIATGTRLGRVI